ncbi:MAG: squalene--hopene cyclase [Opitutales bacterium]|nr:squalene--hopene cyclase [Opitutales bacterium]
MSSLEKESIPQKDIQAKVLTKENLDATIKGAIDWLKARQAPDGMWVGPLETNCCMEAQWLMAMYFIDFKDPKVPSVIQYILDRQRDDGSWDVYYKSEQGDINTTLECYFALRIYGFDPDDQVMQKARKWLLKNKWQERIRVFTKYWLALFGQWPWANTPVLPPEIFFLPKWCTFNIYDFAAWARATMMPVAILTARRPVKKLPDRLQPDELFPEGRDKVDYRMPNTSTSFFSWNNFFMKLDNMLHSYNRLPIKPLREQAIKLILQWILEHQDEDGAWGGIQPPWIYAIIVMHVEGFALDQVNMSRAIDAFNLHWKVRRGEGTMLQASESPIWDTFLTMIALMDAGETPGTCPELIKALDFVLSKENRFYGDWSVKVGKKVEASGWAFQRANNFYPDIDDASIAIIALKKIQKLLPRESERSRKVDAALRRAINWILAMQSKNGGWAAFDRDNTKAIVTKIPFCDFGEVLDPPSSDVTAHVIEALAMCGFSRNHPAIERALKFLYSEQEDDGSWFGRWGVNYIYGTAAVIPALIAVGDAIDSKPIQDALEWLASKQNRDGGWGESIASYMEPKYAGCGIPSTASQTAWALTTFLAVKDPKYREVIERACEFLISTQTPEKTWNEPYYTGTGFPGYGLGAKIDLRNGKPLPQGKELARGFMLNYNWYRHYFPLTALGRAEKYLFETPPAS